MAGERRQQQHKPLQLKRALHRHAGQIFEDRCMELRARSFDQEPDGATRAPAQRSRRRVWKVMQPPGSGLDARGIASGDSDLRGQPFRTSETVDAATPTNRTTSSLDALASLRSDIEQR